MAIYTVPRSGNDEDSNMPTKSGTVAPQDTKAVTRATLLPTISTHNPYAPLEEEEVEEVYRNVTAAVKLVSRIRGKNSRTMVECLPSACSADVGNVLIDALSPFLVLLALYGFRLDKFRPKSTLLHWQLCSVECGWIKFLKYKQAAFFAHYLGGPIPEKPFARMDHPSDLLGSTAGRFIRRIMKGPHALEFAEGVLYAKKAMPRPQQSDLDTAKAATKIVLTTTHTVPESKVPYKGRTVQLSDITQQVERTCREICSRGGAEGGYVTIDDAVLHHPYAPSIRANYTTARSKLGTFGDLIDDGYIQEPTYDDEESPDPSRGIREYEGAVEYVKSIGLEEGEEEHRESGEEEEFRALKLSDTWKAAFKGHYRDIYEHVRREGVEEDLNVELVALAEALKVRVISKGPAYTYFLLKPVQKFFSKLLGKFDMFRLTRETVSTAFLNKKFASGEGLFHSLDYKSATDLLNPLCSLAAVDALAKCTQMPEDIHLLMRAALVGHKIEGETQVWGQLMGSVVSFVILCIVNAAVIRFSYELETGKRCSLRDCPAVVNGDDGLVRSGKHFLSIWEDVASVAGLKPSVGKVYSHETYLNINSTSYTFRDGRFLLAPYVNLGLLYGMQRSGGERTARQSKHAALEKPNFDPRALSLGARHRILLASCPERLIPSVHQAFLAINRDLLSLFQDLPWYIPEEFCGLGLEPVKTYRLTDDVDTSSVTYKYGPSPRDVAVAEYISEHPESNFATRMPTDAPIQIRKVWTTLIPFNPRPQFVRRDVKDFRTQLFDMSEDDIGFLDVATYYIAPTLVKMQIKKDPFAVLHKNQQVWRRACERVLRTKKFKSIHVAVPGLD